VSESSISVSSSNVVNGTANRNDAPSSGSDSSTRSGSQASDPADVRQQALLFRSLMDAPVTVRQLADLAARNADVGLAERGASGDLTNGPGINGSRTDGHRLTAATGCRTSPSTHAPQPWMSRPCCRHNM
jgi:hypothetical protein